MRLVQAKLETLPPVRVYESEISAEEQAASVSRMLTPEASPGIRKDTSYTASMKEQ